MNEAANIHRWAGPEIILVATNLQDGPHLIPHAISQAWLSGAKVLLAHVIKPAYLRTNPEQGVPFVLPSPSLHSVQDQLDQDVKQFQRAGVLCEPIALKGLPQEQIVALAEDRRVDRVITGTRSAESFERVLFGSAAEELLHSLDVPVCIIGPRVRPQVPPNYVPNSILFATSFHHEPQYSAQLALEIAELHQAQCTLLHVLRPVGGGSEERLYLRQMRERDLNALIQGEAELWCSPEVIIREGDVAEEILAEAQLRAADLIVLGATGASALARLTPAGVVHKVIAGSKAPVITLR